MKYGAGTASITASIATRQSFDDPEESLRLLRLWRDTDPGWFPERLDSQEPVRAPLEPDAIERSRAASFGSYWQAIHRRPRVTGSVSRGIRDHGVVKLYVYEHSGHRVLADRAARLLDAFAAVAPPDYGMIHHLTRAEFEEAHLPWWRDDMAGDDEQADVSWAFTSQVKDGLPTLYWRNLFGPPFIELFGRERLLTAPAFAVEEHDWGIALQITEAVPTEETYPAFRAARERAMDHLGRDAFFVPGPGGRPAPRPPVFGPFA